MKQLQLNQKVKQNLLNCRIIEIPKMLEMFIDRI